MAAPRLVVLDMAGTTVRDDGLVLRCFVRAAEMVGLEATPVELNARMGMSKREVFHELARRQRGETKAAAALRDAGYDAFRAILEGVYDEGGAEAMRGAEALFTWLRRNDIRIALNTGFYRAVTQTLIDHLRWRDAVDVVVCVDDVDRGRPAPYMIYEAMRQCGVDSVRDVVVVGDTPSDAKAGYNSAAAAVVGVTSGAHTAATLRREPFTHLLAGVWELPPLIARMGRLGPPSRGDGTGRRG